MSKTDPKLKALIERRFDRQEEEKARKRGFYKKVFWVGFLSGCIGYAMPVFGLKGFTPVILMLIWIICLLIYSSGHILPMTFSKDADLRWHLNPWKDTLDNLNKHATIAESLALLAGPKLFSMICAFAAEVFKAIK